MFCPACGTANRSGRASCSHCQAQISGLRERVSIGAQFVFADASTAQPLALSLDGEEPQVFRQPTLISRHRHGVSLGDREARQSWLPKARGEKTPGPELPVDLPRLSPPQEPNLTAVITERKIYRPREEVHIFVLAPDAPGQEVELEVQLAGQQISKEQIFLDEAGLALRPYADLEEGEYAVLVRRPGDDGRQPARCTFSVAEFALSPLIALLERHAYEAGKLAFRLRVLALSVPYDGPVELALQSAAEGDRVVESQKAQVREGVVEASFDVRKHGGPFRVQVTTPGGEAASVFFPGTGKAERERITICPLGHIAEAGLLPGGGTQEVRGLHVGYDGTERTPVRLESAIDRLGRLVADVQAAVVQVVTFHPLTGETSVFEFYDLAAGDTMAFPIEAPYTLFTVGMMVPRLSYEAWGVVVHPGDLAASLSAPDTAEPGAEIGVRIETDRPAACLLLVYDARLEHESPIPKLGRHMIDAIRAGTKDLNEGAAPSLASMPPWRWGSSDWLGEQVYRGAPRFFMAGARGPRVTRYAMMHGLDPDPTVKMGGEWPVHEAGPGAVAVDAEPLAFVAVPSREDFPELAYMELFPVRDVAERTVCLGDQIGTWRCRAYVVAGLDVQERTADVEAAKRVYAELDLPAIVGQGDDILAGVRYHTRKPAAMAITLPNGQAISGAVMGSGVETFHLTEPGKVTVHIASPEGEDWTSRSVKSPGIQTVTASRLDILRQGETARGERVVVYPGAASVLAETIESLGRYPFG